MNEWIFTVKIKTTEVIDDYDMKDMLYDGLSWIEDDFEVDAFRIETKEEN